MTGGPPQNAPDEPADPNTSDTDSEDSDRDVFLSPGGSQQGSPNDSSGHNDLEQTDQSEDSGQSQNNSGSNETAQTSDDEPDDDGRLSRLARGREPVRRHRSRSHPPTQAPLPTIQPYPRPIHIHAPGEPLCENCQQQEAPAQQNERDTPPQRENPMPRPDPDTQRVAPPTAQGALPQQVSRFGRQIIRPAVLGYLPNFAQQDSRDPPQGFRLPRPAAPKPPKTAKPTNI